MVTHAADQVGPCMSKEGRILEKISLEDLQLDDRVVGESTRDIALEELEPDFPERRHVCCAATDDLPNGFIELWGEFNN